MDEITGMTEQVEKKENKGKKDKKEKKDITTKEIISWIICIAVAVALGFLMVKFVMQRTIVDGRSMNPTLSDGDNLWIEKLTTSFGTVSRGDIVTVHLEPGTPHSDKNPLIKRVIGTPGDTLEIKNNEVFINGNKLEESYIQHTIEGYYDDEKLEITLGDDEYFVMGDNRDESLDSREIGPIKKKNLMGRAFFRFYPFSAFGTIK